MKQIFKQNYSLSVDTKDMKKMGLGRKKYVKRNGKKRKRDEEEVISDWETIRVIACLCLPKAP